MAQFQSEIELRVKVVDKELRDLEKRAAKIQNTNPFSASGGRRGASEAQKQTAALKAQKAELELINKATKQQSVEQIKLLNKRTAWLKVLKEGKQISKDIAAATEKEAKAVAKVAANRKKAESKKSKKNISNLGAGIGFPLLFGGGPGSVIGGAVGSAGGFGTQILASAIGGIIDQAVAGVAKLGQALDPLTADIDAVVAAAGESNFVFKQLVKDLEKVVGKEEALAAATAQLATVIGQDGVSALRQFGAESTELGNEVALALTIASSAVAEFINQTGILATLIANIDASNLKKAAARNTTDPELQRLKEQRANLGPDQANPTFSIAGITIATDFEDQIDALDAAIVARQRLLQTEEQINIAKKAQAAIQAKIDERTASSIALKEQELIIAQNGGDVLNEQVQAALQNIDAEKIRLKILEAQGDQLKLNLAFAEAGLLAALRDAKIAAAEAAAARKAAAEAKRLEREAEQARKKELRVQQQLAQYEIDNSKLAIQAIRLANGEAAAVEAQLGNQDALLAKRIEVINLSDKDQRLKDKEIELARVKQSLEKQTLLNKIQEIALQRELNKLKAEQQIDSVQTGLDQELAGLALGGNDQTDLLQQQANRYANTLKEVNNQIAQQNLLIANTPTPNKEAILAATTQLDVLEKTKSAYEAMLPQIFAAEQAQLKYNQAFAAVTPAVNALVGGLREVVAGTKTAEEAFADFLTTIADQLINTAATMIAQYIAIGIARMFAMGSSGSGFNLSGGGSSVGSGGLPGIDSLGGLFNGALPFIGSGQPSMLAAGGTANGNQPYIVGEKGPELFIPGKTGTVTNNDQFEAARASMSYYGGSSGGSNGGSGTFRLETTVINGVEYATVEQVRAMGKASAREGAAAGNAMTMNNLRNSRSQRSKIGLGGR